MRNFFQSRQADELLKFLGGLLLLFSVISCASTVNQTISSAGLIHVEAEDFLKQEKNELRRWYRADKPALFSGLVDADEDHSNGASGTYLEVLPDTRQTHDDPLIVGENFSNEAGKMAILSYRVKFPEAGRYYVWVRAFYTGTEDNGIHVGINGEWPASGQRLQWCGNPGKWEWQSKQRTEEVHCGVEKMIYLDVPNAGLHTVQFSLREDGFEFDAFRLTKQYGLGTN